MANGSAPQAFEALLIEAARRSVTLPRGDLVRAGRDALQRCAEHLREDRISRALAEYLAARLLAVVDAIVRSDQDRAGKSDRDAAIAQALGVALPATRSGRPIDREFSEESVAAALVFLARGSRDRPNALRLVADAAGINTRTVERCLRASPMPSRWTDLLVSVEANADALLSQCILELLDGRRDYGTRLRTFLLP